MARKRDRPMVCPKCGTALPARRHGPCPNVRNHVTFATEDVHPDSSFRHSLESDTRKDFYERHKPTAVFMIFILFTFPIAGVFVGGLPGLLLGVASSVLGYYLLPYVVRRMGG